MKGDYHDAGDFGEIPRNRPRRQYHRNVVIHRNGEDHPAQADAEIELWENDDDDGNVHHDLRIELPGEFEMWIPDATET